ncbi:hypothetical protein Goari_026090, partial [Gossypium aridum]|nr:hypothetical protein [Gossypium aridum]
MLARLLDCYRKEFSGIGLLRDKFSTDWDKAWSNFKKQSKRSFFSGFSPSKYVTWNPKQSNYPLSEEEVAEGLGSTHVSQLLGTIVVLSMIMS